MVSLRRPIAYIHRMKAYFFDLDGTLTDSRAGLYPAFRSGLKAIGVAAVTDEQLAVFLGTPLPKMFHTLRPDVTQGEIDVGIDAFRSVYEDVGISANELYPGVMQMLAGIRQRGSVCWVVTSKPEFHAVRVVAALKLDTHVAGVIGAGPAETDTKSELVARALATASVASNEATMIGDRHYDVIGALANRVLPVGALWGYGSAAELKDAGCRHFARSPDEFRKLFVETDKGLHDGETLITAGAR
jgi:phosphoglycolate phosphatase